MHSVHGVRDGVLVGGRGRRPRRGGPGTLRRGDAVKRGNQLPDMLWGEEALHGAATAAAVTASTTSSRAATAGRQAVTSRRAAGGSDGVRWNSARRSASAR
jgi:hypothetical protein